MSVDVETNAPIIMEKEFMKFSTCQFRREPVECSDSDENETQAEEKVAKSDETLNKLNDGLSNLLEKCHISEKNSEHENKDKEEDKKAEENEEDDQICTKLSQVSLKEKNLSDNGSVEVVVERIKKEESEDTESEENDSTLSARGPNGGVATNYYPSPDGSNQYLHMKANNFLAQGQDLNFNNPGMRCFQQQYDMVNSATVLSGKRRPDEEGDVPYKFRAPNTQQVTGPLNIQPDKFTNSGPTCGGVMSLQPFQKPAAELDYLDDLSNLLEDFDNPDNLPLTNENLTTMTGDRFSDAHSEGYGSPGHESQFSPMGIDSSPPPSNYSEDSGIPASPDNSRMDAASPASVASPMSQTSEQISTQFWEQRKDYLADVLTVLAKDLMEDKKVNVSKQKNVVDQNNFEPNKQVLTNRNDTLPTRNMVQPMVQQQQLQQQQQQQQTLRAVPRTQPGVVNNPINPVIAANQVAVPIRPIITTSTNNQVPVTSSSLLFISPSVLLVNQTAKNTQLTPKKQTKTFKPILPKLGPAPAKGSPSQIPPSSSQCSSDIKSKVPATVTAVARETAPVRPLANIQPSPTPSPPANIKPKGANSPPESRKLNFARRLVANMTSKDLRFQDSEGDTYLHVAACRADTKFVQAVLERLEREKLTGMVHVQNSLRQTTLYCAVGANNPEMVELLIRYGADVNDQAERVTQEGMAREVNAAIHVASSNGKEYLGTLQALLKSPDIIIDKPNSEGQTALHCAMLCHDKPKKNSTQKIDSTPIIETLIQHNADINAQDMKSGKTPFMYALESKSLHLISLIAKYIKPENSRTYLRTASFDGNTPWKIIENLKSSLDSNSWQKIYDMVTCTNRGNQNMGLNMAPHINVCY